MIDADGSTDGREIFSFVSALVEGADFAKGSRYAPGGGSDDISRLRSLGNRALTGLTNLLYGTRYTDLCYGYNAFWARHLHALDLDCDGFEIETLMNVRAAQAGLTIHEVPSHERSRIHGESNLHAVRDGLRVLRTILRERFRQVDASRDPGGARRKEKWHPLNHALHRDRSGGDRRHHRSPVAPERARGAADRPGAPLRGVAE